MSEYHEIVKKIDEFYAVISGTVEEERDWELFKSIFTHDAKLKPIRKNDSLSGYLSVETYSKQLNDLLKKRDFYEYGLNYEVKVFKNIANVNSEYEAKNRKHDTEIIKRGVNYVHLIKEENTWKISSMIWQDE